MSSSLGKRYERLLMLSAPITLVVFLVFFVTMASDNQKDRFQARCYAVAADALSEKKDILNSQWKTDQPVIQSEFWGSSYKYELKMIFLDTFSVGKCYRVLLDELDKRYRKSPADIIEGFRNDVKTLRGGPLEFYGIELPEKAKLNIFGTGISIDLITLIWLLQLALAPILLLWLGSLYNTRYRESIFIGKASDITSIFPHTINVYPVYKFKAIRKKNWAEFYSRKID